MIWGQDKEVEFSTLIGTTLVRADATDESIEFEDSDGKVYRMDHDQDCCESVRIESIVGDLQDLIGTPILMAEMPSTDGESAMVDPDYPGWSDDSFTWTFYKLATIKGYVDIRWYGSSNGYYSESVDFYLVGGNRKEPA